MDPRKPVVLKFRISNELLDQLTNYSSDRVSENARKALEAFFRPSAERALLDYLRSPLRVIPSQKKEGIGDQISVATLSARLGMGREGIAVRGPDFDRLKESGDLRGNLILVGGPKANPVAAHFLDELRRIYTNCDVTLSEAELRVLRGAPEEPVTIDCRKRDGSTRTAGLVIWFPNPYDPQHHVLFLVGATTLGTWIATQSAVAGQIPMHPGEPFVAILQSEITGLGVTPPELHTVPWRLKQREPRYSLEEFWSADGSVTLTVPVSVHEPETAREVAAAAVLVSFCEERFPQLRRFSGSLPFTTGDYYSRERRTNLICLGSSDVNPTTEQVLGELHVRPVIMRPVGDSRHTPGGAEYEVLAGDIVKHPAGGATADARVHYGLVWRLTLGRKVQWLIEGTSSAALLGAVQAVTRGGSPVFQHLPVSNADRNGVCCLLEVVVSRGYPVEVRWVESWVL